MLDVPREPPIDGPEGPGAAPDGDWPDAPSAADVSSWTAGLSTRVASPGSLPGCADGSTIASTRQSCPITSIAACRRISSLPPLTNELRAPALTSATVSVLASTAADLGVLAEQDPGVAALELDRVEQVRPQPAYLDQAEPARTGSGLAATRLRVGGLGRRPAAAGAGSGWRVRLRLGRRARRGSAACGGGRRRGLVGGLGRRARPGPDRPGAARGPGPGRAPAALGVPSIDIRFSIRSSRAISPSVPWSAPGSSTRAQISSSSSRGAVAPLSSVRPSATSSADRLRSARPNRAACAVSRSPWSCGYVDQAGRRRVGDGGDDHQVAEPAQQVLGEPARVLPGLDHLVDHPEHGAAVAGGEGVDDLVEQGVGGVAEQPGGQLVGDPVGPGAAHQLVEHGQGVAGRAAAGPDHERQRGRRRSATPSLSQSSRR